MSKIYIDEYHPQAMMEYLHVFTGQDIDKIKSDTGLEWNNELIGVDCSSDIVKQISRTEYLKINLNNSASRYAAEKYIQSEPTNIQRKNEFERIEKSATGLLKSMYLTDAGKLDEMPQFLLDFLILAVVDVYPVRPSWTN